MFATLHFDRSEACAKSHEELGDEGERVTERVSLTEGNWIQVTYDTIRGPGGDVIAYQRPGCSCWWLDDFRPFSDIVIEVS